jgi:acetyl-CoA decarbonylase/synthase complex subunit gamma
VGTVATAIGPQPRVRTSWTRADTLGAIRVRSGIGRMRYSVPPGIYAVGRPRRESPVFVSANYKLSFDHLRRALRDIDGWILVLDTKGVNVWCAAGKGTFGTTELVNRIHETQLGAIVSHRRLILPQLGAPGVAAHVVKQASGFRVVYGPVRAADIGAFLERDGRATPEMRQVRFDLPDRLVLVPVEIATMLKFIAPLLLLCIATAGLQRGGFDAGLLAADGDRGALLVLGAWLIGAAATPALLPWLPGRALALKGAVAGLAFAVVALALRPPAADGIAGLVESAAWLLLAPAITSFVAMNFTGATTYTSLSGVRREMRYGVPAQIAAAALGVGALIASRFLG